MLWFKLKPRFEQNQYFCVQTLFYTKSRFTQKHAKTLLSTNTMFYTKNHVLAGPVQGLFAAYRIAALSMVAGGIRRGRLNQNTKNHHEMPNKSPSLLVTS